jgi:hypothetical protein
MRSTRRRLPPSPNSAQHAPYRRIDDTRLRARSADRLARRNRSRPGNLSRGPWSIRAVGLGTLAFHAGVPMAWDTDL